MLMDKKTDAPFLFIDSTEHGKTMYKVLKYAIKKGYEKILVIDPAHISKFGFVVPINPLDYDAPPEAMSSHIMDSVRVLWQTKDFRDESIITKYAPYLIEALHASRHPLIDIESFISPPLVNQRAQILDHENQRWIVREEVDGIYSNRQTNSDAQATLRRFEPFRHSVMKAMLGSVEGINFQQLINEGYIILCNLHPAGVFDIPQQRLLGTILINEVLRAKQRMKGNSVPFHIYIDEFGHYATRKIEQILMYERHLNIYLTLAHQGFFQIEDNRVKAAVKQGCKCKFLFWTLDDKDLYEMIAMMYGGQISDREVKYVLSGLKQGQAAIKIGKQSTRVCDLRRWPDIQMSDKDLDAWFMKHYKTNPQLYRPKAEVWKEIINRFVPASTKQPITTEPRHGEKRSQQEDTSGDKGSTIFDHIANSTTLLRDKKGRNRAKDSGKKTEKN